MAARNLLEGELNGYLTISHRSEHCHKQNEPIGYQLLRKKAQKSAKKDTHLVTSKGLSESKSNGPRTPTASGKIYMLFAYAKNESSDLTKEQLSTLRKFVEKEFGNE